MDRRKVIAALTAALLLSGCHTESKAAETASASTFAEPITAAETTTAAETSSALIEKSISYQELAEKIISEKAATGISTKRENVEYNKFISYTYYSVTAERDTNVNVLLPKGYTEEKEYPVLYVLHGFYDDETWMARIGLGLAEMAQNLIADGEAKEMIIVLPYIFCSKELPKCTGMDAANSAAYDNFINDLTTDLMPFIEKTFSVKKGRENTAVTGFSMGGRESLFIGFTRPDLFGYIGAVCAAPGLVPVPNSPMHPGQLQESELSFRESENVPKLLLLSAAKNDGAVGNTPEGYHNLLTQNDVPHIWHVMSGTGHDASSVKPHLYNFLRVIFNDEIEG